MWVVEMAIHLHLIPSGDAVSTSNWKEITKAYKYEMKPTKNQEVKLNQTLSTCRHLYNEILGERKDGWENGGWNIQYIDQQNYLPEMRNRRDEFGKELREIYAQVLQNVTKRVDTSYQNFFRRVKNNKTNYKKPGFPRFKGYGRYDSFTFPQYGNGADIRVYKSCDDNGKRRDKNRDRQKKDKHIVRISKIGEVKYISHRDIGENEIPYRIKTITIKKEVDKWFVIVTVDTFVEIQIPTSNQIIYKNIEELNEKVVGCDMGLNNLIMLSNRKKVEPPKYLRKLEKRLAIEQRKLSKKKLEEKEIEIIDKKESKKQKKSILVKKKIKVSSKNRDKQIIKVKKIHRKIKNQRRNFSHEVSRTLVDNYDALIFEKLNIQKMMNDHHYAKSIADASWYQIQTFSSYKAEWAGKMTDFVIAKNSTKECSKCHKINDMPIWKRTMICSCGNIEDRDVNSSFVIRDRSDIYQQLKKDILTD
jgi:putative transposase